MALLTSFTRPRSNLTPGFISKNSNTLSSLSWGLRCPIHSESVTLSAKYLSTTLYISALPNLTPEGFRTPSARPRNVMFFVTGWKTQKSPCAQT
jgi:hypothetical protein